MELSLEMHKVNVLPWEMYDSQQHLLHRLHTVEITLCEGTAAQRRRARDIFPRSAMPAMHAYADPTWQITRSRISMLSSAAFMGIPLKMSQEDYTDPETGDTNTESEAIIQALLSLGYQASDWAAAAHHWYKAPFLDDQHGVIVDAGKCMDLHRFAVRDLQWLNNVDNFRSAMDTMIRNSLSHIFTKLREGSGIQLPEFEECMQQARVLACVFQLEVQEHYADGLDVSRLHHWHKLGPGDELKIQSGTVIQKDVLTKSHYYDGRKGLVFM